MENITSGKGQYQENAGQYTELINALIEQGKSDEISNLVDDFSKLGKLGLEKYYSMIKI